MIRPKMRVDQMKVGDQHIAAVRDVDQTRPLLVLICTRGIPSPAQPKRLPGLKPVAVDRTGSAW